LRHEAPNPFFGDVILFLHIVPMMAAVALQPHLQQDDRTVQSVLSILLCCLPGGSIFTFLL
jgi:hypothetical protein